RIKVDFLRDGDLNVYSAYFWVSPYNMAWDGSRSAVYYIDQNELPIWSPIGFSHQQTNQPFEMNLTLPIAYWIENNFSSCDRFQIISFELDTPTVRWAVPSGTSD